MTPLTFAFDALVLVSVADAVTTRLGLRGGGMVETNPLMHWSTRSMSRALATKALGLVFVGACLAQLRLEHPRAALLVALVATWYTGWLAWRNWRLSRAVSGRDSGVDALRYASLALDGPAPCCDTGYAARLERHRLSGCA